MQIDQDLHGLSNFNIFFALIEIKWAPLAKNFDKCPTIRRNNTSPAVLCTGADNNATFKRVPKEDCKPEKRTLPGSSKSEARSPSRVPLVIRPFKFLHPTHPSRREEISARLHNAEYLVPASQLYLGQEQPIVIISRASDSGKWPEFVALATDRSCYPVRSISTTLYQTGGWLTRPGGGKCLDTQCEVLSGSVSFQFLPSPRSRPLFRVS